MSLGHLKQGSLSEVLPLTLFPYEYMNLYPGTSLKFNPKIHLKPEAFFRNLVVKKTPKLLVAFKEDGPTGFLNIGIVGEVVLENDNFIVYGKQRARITRINPAGKTGTRVAECLLLEDSPELSSLADEDKPIILGGIEAIRRWLKKLEPLVEEEEEEMKKEIRYRIDQIESRRRDCELAYSLPWHMLLDLDSYVPKETKVKFLNTDGVVDRLQGIIDFIKLEITVRNCAEALAGEPDAPKEIIETIEGK